MEYCNEYCGLACVDGTCATMNENALELKCDECWLFKGCEDCYFRGTSECIKEEAI